MERLKSAPGRLIIHHRGISASDRRIVNALKPHRAKLISHHPDLGASVIEVPVGTEGAARDSLLSHPLMRDVELDYYASTKSSAPNDPLFSQQWYLKTIQAMAAWSITTGSSAPIAVIDTGVDATHPDLAGVVLPGWNFVASTSDSTDSLGYGTAVAGVIAAKSNNAIGVCGITWKNPILPLVVVDANDYAAYSNIGAAIQYAVDFGARILNISIGGAMSSTFLQSAVDYAWSKGAVVFSAAMNNGSSAPYYPAACDKAVALSATDGGDAIASFSDFGPWIVLSAPGTAILTTAKGGGYQEWEGTSFASPIAAAVAALVLAVNPSLSAAALVDLLIHNSDDLGTPGRDDKFGWGRINAFRAVSAAAGSPVPASAVPQPKPNPMPSPFQPISIDAGRTSGRAWSPDADFSGGTPWSTTQAVTGTDQPELYRTCRYGAFTYSFTVPNGNYVVTLKFCEPSRFGVGARVFNVSINDAPVLTDFDIFAQAGSLAALDRSIPVSVSNGVIVIKFTEGKADEPLICAIQIDAA
jgi:subtilisin family serine protease